MPIYMDRHFLEGATKDAVAAAHQLDLELQGDFDVNILTYWVDEARSSAFCLAEAPSANALRDLHANAHGFVPNEVSEVDPILVKAFLGRIEDPVPDPAADDASAQDEIGPAYRSIMFTDLKDSTQIAVQLGDKEAMNLLRVHNAMTREALSGHNGREVKTTGDGFLLSFENAMDALSCAIAIQRSFREYNERSSAKKLFVRIGVAAGEPIEDRGDLYGSAVNLASRLCDQANAGGVLIARTVIEDIGDQGSAFQVTPRGELVLKGFADPVDVYELLWD